MLRALNFLRSIQRVTRVQRGLRRSIIRAIVIASFGFKYYRRFLGETLRFRPARATDRRANKRRKYVGRCPPPLHHPREDGGSEIEQHLRAITTPGKEFRTETLCVCDASNR